MTSSRAAAGARVEIVGLTKRFGGFLAVDDLTFTVEPGRITGFLGPNGAGKTTSLRMLLGLIHPTAGTATIDGTAYHDLSEPLTVGAALEATNFHPGRSGRDHLRVLAAASGLPDSRVDELLELTGIPAFARRRAGMAIAVFVAGAAFALLFGLLFTSESLMEQASGPGGITDR